MHHQLRKDEQGSATRNRTWTSMSSRKGTLTTAPPTRPPQTYRISSGSQSNSETRTIRQRKSSSASPDRWACRMIWYSGPPTTTEKLIDPAAPSHVLPLPCPLR